MKTCGENTGEPVPECIPSLKPPRERPRGGGGGHHKKEYDNSNTDVYEKPIFFCPLSLWLQHYLYQKNPFYTDDPTGPEMN
jgi:hypothetical protein